MSNCFVGFNHKHSKARSCDAALWKIESETNGYPSAIHPIVGWVIRQYGLSLADLLALDRRELIVEPRSVAMYLMSTVGKLSAVTIGDYMERHYSTVLHAVDKTAYQIRYTDQRLREIIDLARKEIGNPSVVCTVHLGEYLDNQTPIAGRRIVWEIRRERE